MVAHHVIVFLAQRRKIRRASCRRDTGAAAAGIVHVPPLLPQSVPLHEVAVLLHDGVVPLALIRVSVVRILLELEQRSPHRGRFFPGVHRMLLHRIMAISDRRIVPAILGAEGRLDWQSSDRNQHQRREDG